MTFHHDCKGHRKITKFLPIIYKGGGSKTVVNTNSYKEKQ